MELVNTLDMLLSNPSMLEVYSQNAYNTAKRYSFNIVSAAWQNFLSREGIF